MVSILKDTRYSAYGVRHFVADIESDIKTIDTRALNPGSTVFVIDNSKTFMLNSKKQWISIAASSGSGSGGGSSGGGDYDGGGVNPNTPPPGGDGPVYDGGGVRQ